MITDTLDTTAEQDDLFDHDLELDRLVRNVTFTVSPDQDTDHQLYLEGSHGDAAVFIEAPQLETRQERILAHILAEAPVLLRTMLADSQGSNSYAEARAFVEFLKNLKAEAEEDPV